MYVVFPCVFVQQPPWKHLHLFAQFLQSHLFPEFEQVESTLLRTTDEVNFSRKVRTTTAETCVEKVWWPAVHVHTTQV